MTSASSQPLRAEMGLEEEQESDVVARRGDTELTDEEAERSATNIALWRVYLPEDCVEAMISMGWDLTA